MCIYAYICVYVCPQLSADTSGGGISATAVGLQLSSRHLGCRKRLPAASVYVDIWVYVRLQLAGGAAGGGIIWHIGRAGNWLASISGGGTDVGGASRGGISGI